MGYAPCKAGHEHSVRYYMIWSKSHVRWVVAFVGDNCVLSEACHTPFETGLDSHVCDRLLLLDFSLTV